MIDKEKSKERFISIKESIIKGLTPRSYLVYSVLRFEASYKTECSPVTRKVKFISNQSNIPVSQVYKCLNELELRGLVQRKSTLGEQTTYQVAQTLDYFNNLISRDPYHQTQRPLPSNPKTPLSNEDTLATLVALPVSGTRGGNKTSKRQPSDTLYPLNPDENATHSLKTKDTDATRPDCVNHPPLFLEFWKAYPKKEGEVLCLKIWDKKGLESIGNVILEKLAEHNKSSKFLRGFAFSPVNYLRDERWKDEIDNLVKQAKHEEEVSFNKMVNDMNWDIKKIDEIIFDDYNKNKNAGVQL